MIHIQQRRPHGRYVTRWSFTSRTQAERYWAGLNAYDGWVKRMVIDNPDGTTTILRREAW